MRLASQKSSRTMRVILTSFRDADNWKGAKYSVARWQPKEYHFMRFPVAVQPVWKGKPMVHLHPDEFRVLYETILGEHTDELKAWFNSRNPADEIVLLCWCYPERQPKYDKLYCHRILLGYWIEKNFPLIEVVYADGADNPIWERK